MSAMTIPSYVRITGVLIIAAIAVFPPVATIKAGSLDSEYAPPPLLFDDAPASITRKESNIDPSVPLIRCYCDLNECLAATGGIPVCRTRQGCFSKIQTTLFDFTRATTVRPIPEEFDYQAVGEAYGCLDLLPIKQTCNEILKLTEDPASEFPFLPSSKSSETVHAYHCCQDNMCNDRTNPAATPIRVARQAINAVFQTSTLAQQRELLDDSSYKTFTWLSPYHFRNVQNNGAEIKTNNKQTSDLAMPGKKKWLDFINAGNNHIYVVPKPGPVVAENGNNAKMTNVQPVVTVNGNQIRTEHEVQMNNEKTSDVDIMDEENFFMWQNPTNDQNTAPARPVLMVTKDDADIKTKHEAQTNNKEINDLAMLDKMNLYKWLDSTKFGNNQKTVIARPFPVVAENGNNVQPSGAGPTTKHSQDNSVETAPEEFPIFSLNPPIYWPPANDMSINTVIKIIKGYQKNRLPPSLFNMFNGPLRRENKIFPATYAETSAKACSGVNCQLPSAAFYE